MNVQTYRKIKCSNTCIPIFKHIPLPRSFFRDTLRKTCNKPLQILSWESSIEVSFFGSFFLCQELKACFTCPLK